MDLYSKLISAVRVDGELTEWFRMAVGVRHRCGLSPDLFNLSHDNEPTRAKLLS